MAMGYNQHEAIRFSSAVAGLKATRSRAVRPAHSRRSLLLWQRALTRPAPASWTTTPRLSVTRDSMLSGSGLEAQASSRSRWPFMISHIGLLRLPACRGRPIVASMSNTRAPRTDRVVHWLELLGLALVLALAGFLRLGWPGVNSFGFDEARVSLLALKMAREGEISSVGILSSVKRAQLCSLSGLAFPRYRPAVAYAVRRRVPVRWLSPPVVHGSPPPGP